MIEDQIKHNISLFDDLPEIYNRYHPDLPLCIVELLVEKSSSKYPDLVIDLGSGSGLSSRVWANLAKEIIGIEPNDKMRFFANTRKAAENISYQFGYGHNTNLKDNIADIVQVVQSFHWMEPCTTLKEINRVLRSGGLFTVIDCIWPVFINREIKSIEDDLTRYVKYLIDINSKIFGYYKKWKKELHFEQIKRSNYFHNIQLTKIQVVIKGDFSYYQGLFYSHGHIRRLTNLGYSFTENPHLDMINHIMGEKEWPICLEYQIITCYK